MNTRATLEPKGFSSVGIGAGETEMGMGQVGVPRDVLLFLRVRHFPLINTH